MKIPKRIAGTVINALKGGVVPRIGLPYITVGRDLEIQALLHDVEIIGEGGASFRFISGRYGSGKSFLLQSIRNYVMDRGFVVMDADLSPERRLQGTKGQGLATYRELIRNLSTKTRPEGGALSLILDRWISSVTERVQEQESMRVQETESAEGQEWTKGCERNISAGAEIECLVDREIQTQLYAMNEMVHGFDFGKLLSLYYQAYRNEDMDIKAKVVKWFRGEYGTKTEAKQELGVNFIITDEDWYEYVKLFAVFFRSLGYQGLLVLVDELVNIYKITNSITRQNNYEKILTMYNDTLQGKAKHLGIIMCGTPQCIEDKHRGVYSYEALRSRLSEGRFSGEQRDMLAPVIPLEPLSNEEMLVLIEKLSEIHGSLFSYEPRLTEQELAGFLQIEYGRIGADSHITPRELIRDFIELLDILYQNPELKPMELLESKGFSFAKPDLEAQAEISSEFAEFEL